MNTVCFALAALVIAWGPMLAAGSESNSKTETELEEKARELLSTEPIACVRGLVKVDKEITVGLGVRLCSGTTSAVKTVACYAAAWAPASDGGLGLSRGQAIDLCRTNSLPGS